jgi:hypothetical protein
MKCEYGCNQEANYQLGNGKWCCSIKSNKCPEIRKKNAEGLKKSYNENERRNVFSEKQFEQHRSAWCRGKTIFSDERLGRVNTPETVFCKDSHVAGGMLKRWIIYNRLLDYKCGRCGIKEWLDQHLSLELHHKNGDRKDNRLENLQFLCLNCHSLTDTFRGRNIKRKNYNCSDEELLYAIKNTKNIRQTLMMVGLTQKGGNYNRIRDLMLKNNLKFN